jgi:hypothetical protein
MEGISLNKLPFVSCMAKKRVEKKQKSYEVYKKTAARIAVVGCPLGAGFLLASFANLAFDVRAKAIEFSVQNPGGLTPYLRETIVPQFAHTWFLTFLYLGILFCALYFLQGKSEWKTYACSSLITASLFGFVRPSYEFYRIAQALKDNIVKITDALASGKEPPSPSIKAYVIQTFLPSYLIQIAIVMVLLGVLLLSVYFLTDKELARKVGCVKVVVGGGLGVVGEVMTVYYMIPKMKNIVEIVSQYISAGQGNQIGFTSVEEFIGKQIVPLMLENGALVLFFLGASLLFLYFIWEVLWGKSVGSLLLICSGFLAAFQVFLSTAYQSMDLGSEITKVRGALTGGQPIKVGWGGMEAEVSSMLGYFTRKFIPYYLDQFSSFLFFVAAMILAFYVLRKKVIFNK